MKFNSNSRCRDDAIRFNSIQHIFKVILRLKMCSAKTVEQNIKGLKLNHIGGIQWFIYCNSCFQAHHISKYMNMLLGESCDDMPEQLTCHVWVLDEQSSVWNCGCKIGWHRTTAVSACFQSQRLEWRIKNADRVRENDKVGRLLHGCFVCIAVFIGYIVQSLSVVEFQERRTKNNLSGKQDGTRRWIKGWELFTLIKHFHLFILD